MRARTGAAGLRRSVLVLFTIVLCVDNPFESPFAKMWESPLSPFANVLYENLHKFTGVEVLRFSLLIGLILFFLARALLGSAAAARAGSIRSPQPLRTSLAVLFGTLVVLELWGLVRGGDFRESLWQFQYLLFLPAIATMFDLTIRGPRDQRALARIIIGAAFFKTFLGAYFLYFVARPRGLEPPYVTQHTDTVLFVSAVAIVIALWMEQSSLRNTLLCFVVLPVVGFGIGINDRRLAYVSAAASVLTIFVLSPWNRSKRFLVGTLVVLFPLLVGYSVVGWNSSSRIFKPVRVLHSVVSPEDTKQNQADSSTHFRTLENVNLVKTWMENPVLGSGFGHPYSEVLKLPDISKYFPSYRYVPHNGILWLWSIGGLVGFPALTMFLSVGVFFAARGYRASRTPENRAAALVSLCIIVTFLAQAFGDMGTQSWESMFLLAAALAVGGKLAVVSGAWPSGLPPREGAPA